MYYKAPGRFQSERVSDVFAMRLTIMQISIIGFLLVSSNAFISFGFHMSPSESATHIVRAFIDAFNQQDHEALAATMNFPHIRLANGRFLHIETADKFIEGSRRAESKLREEGWQRTDVESLEVIHAGDDKVHIALTNLRVNQGGTVYNRFETLWVATFVDGKWGIQFRSSFLTPPSLS